MEFYAKVNCLHTPVNKEERIEWKYKAVLEITVGHWPFSYQYEHLADQNLF